MEGGVRVLGIDEDSFYLLCFYLLFWLISIVFLKVKRKVLVYNMLIQFVYTVYFQFKFFTDSEGGFGLFWLLLNMLIIGLHVLLCIILHIFNVFKNQKNKI